MLGLASPDLRTSQTALGALQLSASRSITFRPGPRATLCMVAVAARTARRVASTAPAAERRPHLGLEECAAELVAGVRPVRQPGDALSVERDDRRAVRRVEQAKVLVQAAQYAVAASPDGRQVVHEDQVVRADLLVAGQGLHVRDAVGGSRPRVALVDLGEVRDGHRLTVDEEFEVVRLETANPIPFPVRDDDFDVDDPHVHRVRKQLRQRALLRGGGERGQDQSGDRGEAIAHLAPPAGVLALMSGPTSPLADRIAPERGW